jgi:hypothetical protein
MRIPRLDRLAGFDVRYADDAREFASLFVRAFNCDPKAANAEWRWSVRQLIDAGSPRGNAIAELFTSWLGALRERCDTLPDCAGWG